MTLDKLDRAKVNAPAIYPTEEATGSIPVAPIRAGVRSTATHHRSRAS